MIAPSGLHLRAALLCLTALFAGVTAADPPDDLLELAALRGKVVYVDFWASWCGPCRQSFPWMNDMAHLFARDGLVVIAVNVDHERADADRFLTQYAPQFPIRFDPEGVIAERFHVKGMPTSVLIDRNGSIHSTHAGFRPKDREALEQEIRTLLALH